MFDDAMLAQLLPAVIDLVRQASRAVMDIYDAGDPTVDYKADNSPVTEADLAANRIIINGLHELTPTIPVVSEELLGRLGDIDAQSTYWLVDPIDGTKEFLSHNGEFTVNIGLIVQAEPLLGVVAAPALDTLYYGYQGGPAFKQIGNAQPQPIRVRPPGKELIAAISRSHSDEQTQVWLREHGLKATQPIGSSLKMCLVAEGKVDVAPRLGPQREWDIAAADAVLRAAGGAIYRCDDKVVYPYGKPTELTVPYIATADLRLV